MLKQLILVMCSTLVSIILLEIGLRTITNYPITRTSNRIPDPELGYRIDPKFSGTDEYGFRNPKTLSSAEIVTIGDSHTYGENVDSEDSWPQQLGRMMNASIYNFGTGGYGVIQYEVLLDDAIRLSPEFIIIGLYFANDLNDILNGFKLEYGKRWARSKQIELDALPQLEKESKKKENASDKLPRTAIFSLIRQLLSNHRQPDGDGVFVREEKNKTLISNRRIQKHEKYMDIRTPAIERAFGITKQFINNAKRKADANDIGFLIFLIPSKESVFYNYLLNKQYKISDSYHNLVRNEMELVAKTKRYLEVIGVDYSDALSGMENALTVHGNVYPPNDNGHPLPIGYKVYAETVYQYFLRSLNTNTKSVDNHHRQAESNQ